MGGDKGDGRMKVEGLRMKEAARTGPVRTSVTLKKLARIQDILRIQGAFDPLMQGQIFW